MLIYRLICKDSVEEKILVESRRKLKQDTFARHQDKE